MQPQGHVVLGAGGFLPALGHGVRDYLIDRWMGVVRDLGFGGYAKAPNAALRVLQIEAVVVASACRHGEIVVAARIGAGPRHPLAAGSVGHHLAEIAFARVHVEGRIHTELVHARAARGAQVERGGLTCGRIVPAEGERDAVLLGGLGVRVSCGCGGGGYCVFEGLGGRFGCCAFGAVVGRALARAGCVGGGRFRGDRVRCCLGVCVARCECRCRAHARDERERKGYREHCGRGLFHGVTSLMAGGGFATHGTVLSCDICWRHSTIANPEITAQQGDFW